jgi:Pyruvate/2-oxoacid:ferredoxin oxidoreductase gamma subunit
MRGAQVGIFIKMNPSDAPNDNPDIVLGLEKSTFNRNKNLLETLVLGDEITFKGNLEHMGDEFSYHTIRLESIIKTGRNFEMSQIDYFSVTKPAPDATVDIGFIEPEEEDN